MGRVVLWLTWKVFSWWGDMTVACKIAGKFLRGNLPVRLLKPWVWRLRCDPFLGVLWHRGNLDPWFLSLRLSLWLGWAISSSFLSRCSCVPGHRHLLCCSFKKGIFSGAYWTKFIAFVPIQLKYLWSLRLQKMTQFALWTANNYALFCSINKLKKPIVSL